MPPWSQATRPVDAERERPGRALHPEQRSVAGASGIRIRIGTKRVTNGGDETDLLPLGHALLPGAVVKAVAAFAAKRPPDFTRS